MSEKNYPEYAKIIIDQAGGTENIIEVYHCMSRLRVRVKDVDKVVMDEIKKLPFNGAALNGNQVQVIAGNDVYDLYDAVIAITGDKVALGELDEAAGEQHENEHKKKSLKSIIFGFFGGIAGSVQPMIPVLIGAGVLQGVYLILESLGVLSPDSSTYQILSAVCNAPFYFFPIFVGFSTAKTYGGNPMLGAFFGACLVHPTFLGLVETGEAITFLGLPVRSVTYTSTVLPAFVTVYFMCIVEKWVGKHSPKSIRVVMEPFVTVLIMIPLMFWVTAPIGDYIAILINAIITFIHDVTGPFAPAIIAACIPFLVLTGTHSIIGTLAVPMLVSTGIETVMMPGALLHNTNHAALSMAIGLKSKNSDRKSTAFSSAFTAFVGGISEPSLFGFFARYRSAMIALIAGQFAAGLYCGLTGTGIHAFPAGGPAFLQLTAFMGGSSANFINAIIACVIGMAVTFIIEFILYKDDEPTTDLM
jgi:PTS system beta-glucosides-specific IIC component